MLRRSDASIAKPAFRRRKGYGGQAAGMAELRERIELKVKSPTKHSNHNA